MVVVIFDLEFQSLLCLLKLQLFIPRKIFLKNLLQNMPARQIVFLLKATFWEEGFSVINGCLLKKKKENFSFCYQQRQQTKREHFWPLLVMFALILKFRNFSINGRKCIALRENWGNLLQKLKIRVTKNGEIFIIFLILFLGLKCFFCCCCCWYF